MAKHVKKDVRELLKVFDIQALFPATYGNVHSSTYYVSEVMSISVMYGLLFELDRSYQPGQEQR